MTDTDLNGDLPMWGKLAYRYGLPAAIAAFLVWFVTQGIASDVRTTKDAVLSHIQENRYYLHAICVNAAGDDAGLARCLPPEAR